MRNVINILLLVLLCQSAIAQIENIDRKEIVVPDILDYKTLKCDFHLHTVFSDGSVWPTVRVTEAWELGYDAIAITDHIESKPKRKYIPIDYNAPNEIAKNEGALKDIIVIAGGEISRRMPPGHMNAIFVTDVSEIITAPLKDRFAEFKERTYVGALMDSLDRTEKEYMKSLEVANQQGGFVFWNHPGPPGKYDTLPLYDEHKELIEMGLLHGVEVSGWGAYWPESFQWCLDYDLTMVSNSDYHQPTSISDKSSRSDRRNITLVFAKERTEASIKEALVERRTAVWVNDLVIGKELFIRPLAENALNIAAPHFVDGRRRKYVKIANTSDFLFDMEYLDGKSGGYFDNMILKPHTTQILVFNPGEKEKRFRVRNFHTRPDERLIITVSVE